MVLKRITLAEVEVKTGTRNDTFYIQTNLKEEGKEGFAITLSDGTTVWEGSVSEDDLDQLCTKRKMDFNTYVDQTRAAFTQEDMADMCFEFHMTLIAGDKDAQFVWKKHIVEDDIKFQLGSIKLKKMEEPALQLREIFSKCVCKTKNLQAQINALQTDNERLSMDRQNALKRLDKCVSAKEAMEKDLYSKFAAALNSKKERIRYLQENGTDQTPEDDPPPTSSRSQCRRPRHKVDARSNIQRDQNYEDAYDVDTDDESSSRKQRHIAAAPQEPANLSSETSVKLGDDDLYDTDSKSPVVRRPRRNAPNRKQPPVKPVLPRVSSGNSTERRGSASRRTSLRKSGSTVSNKSSDNLDPDDLLKNL